MANGTTACYLTVRSPELNCSVYFCSIPKQVAGSIVTGVADGGKTGAAAEGPFTWPSTTSLGTY